jgi:tRNA threonylcarbamoyladenosine biosynthesis protein TsaB
MFTLAAVVAAHGSVLVLDAATNRMQVGLFHIGHAPVWRHGGDDASIHLFAAVEDCLAGTALRPTEIGAFVFCEGPGGQLGLRTAAMALRTWQALRPTPSPVFAYRSLAVAALTHQRGGAEGPFALIADARREHWHAVRTTAPDSISAVLRVSNEELQCWPEPLFLPAGFRTWSPPPRPAANCAYDCAAIWTALADDPVLQSVASPEPWQPAPQAYKTWTGERHRAATPAS